MSTYLLPKTVIKQIDKFHKHCLWRGSDVNSEKTPKAALPMACISKESGGLGILNLHTHNQSLLLKKLHKFFNRLDIPWVHLAWTMRYSNGRPPTESSRKGSFWWRDIQKLLPAFKGMAMAAVGNGSPCFFCLDSWNGFSLSTSMAELFSFVKNKHVTVQQVCQSTHLHDNFRLPLSEEVFQQFTQLRALVQSLVLAEGFDTWSYIWNSSLFSSKRAYVHLIGTRQVHPVFSWL